MQKPLRLAVLIPASVLLAAGGPCSEGTDNPVVERCATSHTITVERGAKSAAIPNLCATTVNTTEWDRTRWDVTFDLPPPLTPSADWPGPDRPVYTVEAPMAASPGEVVGSLSVQLKGSQCTSALGAVADCVAKIELSIKIVEPGTVQPLSVRIATMRPAGTAVGDDGRVALTERVTLTAIPEGEGAAEATFAWRALDLVGGAVDVEVDGKTSREVVTSPFEFRERAYEVTATARGLTARAVLVLGGQSSAISGPAQAVSSYPGAPWVLAFDMNSHFFTGSARLEFLPESATWTRDEQDAFLRDPTRQARAVWATLGPNPEDRMRCDELDTRQADCEVGFTDLPTYYAADAAIGQQGLFRAVFWGSVSGNLANFSHTFVRRY